MQKAINLIVDARVRLNDRKVLEDLMIHRQQLAQDLKRRTDFDYSLSISQIDEEIAVIKAGIERLAEAALGHAG
jgi:hypothetical protein